jgi:hypothetical protein
MLDNLCSFDELICGDIGQKYTFFLHPGMTFIEGFDYSKVCDR